MKSLKRYKKIKKWVVAHKLLVAIFVIFLFEIFFRFYQIEQRSPFGYDQVDNAWAAKNLIVNHKFPLVGMVAKGNSGIYIGPAYYYFISFFYFLTNLNPIASGITAGVTSIFSFWALYFVAKKIFGSETALIAVTLNTFNFNSIYLFDRIQWPVNFIPGVSILIFYFLYKAVTGDIKKLIPLALFMGFAFHIHFTAIFFPIIILLSLPLFPISIDTLKYAALSSLLFIVLLIPQFIYILSNHSYSSNSSYISSSFHGFHLVRLFQLVGDAFIQFDHFLLFDWLKKIKLIFPILFFITYFKNSKDKNKYKFLYLLSLWFLVPWAVFTTYSGEISDYYFAINRFLALLIISYLIYFVWTFKNLFSKALIVGLVGAYALYNFVIFFPYQDKSLDDRYPDIFKSIERSQKVGFTQGAPESYLYYYLMRKRGIEVY